jgi:glycosyltransferase involved in cell wall biosynthesis
LTPLKTALRQVQGGSGVDVWCRNHCQGLRAAGSECSVEFYPFQFQFMPITGLLRERPHGPDIVHGNSWNAYLFRGSCPLVVTEHLVVHDPALAPYKSPAQKLYHRWIYHCEKKSFNAADTIVSVSRYTQQKVEETFGLSDTTMIYNGVDPSIFHPSEAVRASWGIPENTCVLLYTGNLTRRKGADLLPALMKQLGDRFLLLTTSGNRNYSLNNIPYSRNIGYVKPEQLVQVYNLCDIFVIPSRMEGLSLSTLEAMACGKPVIAFNCSSFPELVVDGKGGFLPEKDDVHGMTERVRYLAGEPELARRMGAFNRERVLEQFTIERMTGKYLNLYRTLAG